MKHPDSIPKWPYMLIRHTQSWTIWDRRGTGATTKYGLVFTDKEIAIEKLKSLYDELNAATEIEKSKQDTQKTTPAEIPRRCYASMQRWGNW